ncbi:hypothetical protein ACWEWD_19275 [Streptomyces tendae]
MSDRHPVSQSPVSQSPASQTPTSQAPTSQDAASPGVQPPAASYVPLHLLLSLTSAVVVLVSLNRKSPATLAFVTDSGFLRWVEAGNMLLGLCTVLLYHLIAAHLTRVSNRSRSGASSALGVLFVTGAYLYALSLGDHEVTNLLHGRFCSDSAQALCRVVAFHDDVFSDVLFLGGFTVLNVTVMLTQVLFPHPRPPRPRDTVLLSVNALFTGAAITANLAFEKAVFDPLAVAATALLALLLLRRSPRQPMLRYYAVAYTLGLLATVAVKVG